MWARCYAINAGGAFYLTRACVPHLSAHAHKGAIVNVASAAVNVPALAGAAYTASKHAIVGLTKSVANRERGKLTCNAVLPGREYSLSGTSADGAEHGSSDRDKDLELYYRRAKPRGSRAE